MLYIGTPRGTNEWKVGQEFPRILLQYVTDLQADGDELKALCRAASFVPRSTKRIRRWFAGDAQRIYGRMLDKLSHSRLDGKDSKQRMKQLATQLLDQSAWSKLINEEREQAVQELARLVLSTEE